MSLSPNVNLKCRDEGLRKRSKCSKIRISEYSRLVVVFSLATVYIAGAYTRGKDMD